MKLKDVIESVNTGLDAIQRAPIVNYDTGIKCLRIGDISQKNNFENWGFSKVNEENFKKFKLKKNDILIARTGNTIGVNIIIKKDLNSVYNNGLIRLRIKNKYNPLYIYYLIQSKKFNNYIKSICFGTSTQPNMKINDLLEFEIPNIELNKQSKIANILEKLDNKIELNNQTNDNLLEIANELLKKDFKEAYDIEVLSNVIRFVKGKKPNKISKFKQENYEKYLTIACLNSQELNYADKDKMLIADNDLLMVMDGASSGDVYYSDYGIVGSTLARVDITNNQYISEFIYFALKHYKNLVHSKNTGSAIPHTDKVFVGTLEVPKINIEQQERYKTLLTKIQKNDQENEILKKLRDTLLPKLINGEIDLDKIEI